MKGRSSFKVQRELPAIRKHYWGCRFWGRGCFSTTNGAIAEDIVFQYRENHIADPRRFIASLQADPFVVLCFVGVRLLMPPGSHAGYMR
ncbi:transposase [Sedimentitalea sp. JM2-8]|uniref:Transposase n=1 Tax=Sedimentitalea xiamensis TaxID=3050037 RepID=A0ABT7FK01_9RHOB|nr:transposase [Sedimentitalea xiamensis]